MPITRDPARIKELVAANLPKDVPGGVLAELQRLTERLGDQADFMLVSSRFVGVDGKPLPFEMIIIKGLAWYEFEIPRAGPARFAFVDLGHVADTWLEIREQGDAEFRMYLVSQRQWQSRAGGEGAADVVALAEHVMTVLGRAP